MSAATFFTSGAAILHGPHHAAQKSTSTGTLAPRRTLSKISGSASIGSETAGISALHATACIGKMFRRNTITLSTGDAFTNHDIQSNGYGNVSRVRCRNESNNVRWPSDID